MVGRSVRWVAALGLVAAAACSADGRAADRVPTGGASADPSAAEEQAGTSTAPTTTEAAPPTTAPVDRRFHVAPSGSDDAPGTEDRPMATIAAAMERLRPGDTLIIQDGRYQEDIELDEELTPGTADDPIVVEAAPGARPVIQGRLALYDADYWQITGLSVTWSDRNDSKDHMVVFNGGVGFRFSDAELSGARSFSAIVVGEGSRDFRLDGLYVHDTQPSNDRNQDHLIYLASDAVGGTVERNLLVRSPNGRGVKLGPGDLDDTGAHRNVIRYNTFVANEGPSNIQLSGDSSGNEIYGNLFVRPGPGSEAVTAWRLTGSDNIVRDNAAWDTDAVLEREDGLVDGGGNVLLDPRFAAPDQDDYRPTNPAAARYGVDADA